ncbi:MAG: mechanosensitive ion channel family protein, partial [Tannerellaceae bacterium]|nr:mechanosensitive ion channel family protein [Tannerellaceae bacterium]
MVIESYFLQIILSAVVILLLPITRYIARKLVSKYGRLIHMPDARIMQVKHIIMILLNIIFIFTIAMIWGVDPNNLLLGLSSV